MTTSNTLESVRVGDIGTRIRVRVLDNGEYVDISLASSIIFVFTRIDGSVFERTATYAVVDGEYWAQYVIVANDLDTVGEYWTLQVRAVFPDPNGGTWSSEEGSFAVQRRQAASA